MTYVVYHITSTQSLKTFTTESGAKRSTTCANRNAKSIQYAYTDVEDYNKNVVHMMKSRNLMTGKEIEIPSNTPWSCNPASESYWSA